MWARVGAFWRTSGWMMVVAMLVLGCSNHQQAIRLEHMLYDMSPGFETVSLSHFQRMVRRARALDLNERQLADDVDNIMLVRRPLRSSIYSIP